MLLASGLVAPLGAAIIGTNPPALPVTFERIATLPAVAQPAWKKYLEHSIGQRRDDQKIIQRELRSHHLQQPVTPPAGHSAASLPLNNDSGWYGGDAARRIADNVVSFQTPAGGWSKNLDLTRHPRAPGEMFGPENGSHFLATNDFDAPLEQSWNYVGTIDNDATTTELQFLAKVIAAVGAEKSAAWRKSFLRGLDYLFAAQFPNGGWPQVWPLQGGYHDTITINDDAVLNVLELLDGSASGQGEFVFVPAKYRKLAAVSFKKGMDCLLGAEVVVNGHRTIWCQQYDALTLQPASARNYEMPALASGESATILLFLTRLPAPDPAEATAAHAAAAWFEKTKIMDVAFKSSNNDGRHLIAAPGNGPIWARYYRIGDDQPLFGDRDKTIHDNVDEISRERRQGYAWYNDTAKRALEHFDRWSKAHPLAN